MRSNSKLHTFMLNSNKEEIYIWVPDYAFEIGYSLFLQVFGLQDKVTGEFEADKWFLDDILTKKVYMDVFHVLPQSITYSYLNLYTFFSHMYIHKQNEARIGIYKKGKDLMVVADTDTQNSIWSKLKIEKLLLDTPLIKVYATDFYPEFTFKSEEEQAQLSFVAFDNSYDYLVTITTDNFTVNKDNSNSWVFVPQFDVTLCNYLYLKYQEFYTRFLQEYQKKKVELAITPQDEEDKNQYGISKATFKHKELSRYKFLQNYLEEMILLFKVTDGGDNIY